MITKRPARLQGFPYRGAYRYFLTACTNYRHDAFRDRATVDSAREQLLRCATEFGFAVIAYCFMPDHLHVLLHGETVDADFREFVKRFKQKTGFQYARDNAGSRLWQPGYHERVLRDDESSLAATRYILENPIRAGLAETLGDYAFTGSAVYTLDQLRGAYERGPDGRT